VAMLVAVLDEPRDLHEKQQDDNNEQRKGSHRITKKKVQPILARKQ